MGAETWTRLEVVNEPYFQLIWRESFSLVIYLCKRSIREKTTGLDDAARRRHECLFAGGKCSFGSLSLLLRLAPERDDLSRPPRETFGTRPKGRDPSSLLPTICPERSSPLRDFVLGLASNSALHSASYVKKYWPSDKKSACERLEEVKCRCPERLDVSVAEKDEASQVGSVSGD